MWKPKDGEFVYLLESTGLITRQTYKDEGLSRQAYYLGNVFKTREDARAEKETRLLNFKKRISED